MRMTGTSLLLVLSAAALPGSAHTQFCWTEDSRRYEVNARGTVEFSDDDRDVKSLSPGGYFRVEENYLLLFSGRRYEVTADASGRLSRAYFDHGRPTPLDSQGEAWLMGIMPQVIRKTGLGAGPRLQRILKQGGVSAALSEISRIRDDGSKRIYLEELIRHGNLDTGQLESAMLQARKIGSDEDKSDLLIAVAPYFLKDNLRETLFQTAGGIASDEDHSRVLFELVKRDSGNRETLRLAAKSAGRIADDEEKAEVLVEISQHAKGDWEVGRALLSSANSISSDEERHQVLSAVLAGGGMDRETLVALLRSAAGISSDEEKAALLIEAAPHYVEDDAVRREFFSAAGHIASDEERRHVLTAMLQRSGLNDATLAEVVRCARSISSDEEKAGVLAQAAASNLEKPSARAAFFDAANSISSDEARKGVLLLVAHRAGTGAETQVEVLKSARQIASDEEKAAVLAEMTGSNFQDEKLRDAFFEAVDSISSDEERGRILSALLKKPGLGKGAAIRAVESAGQISSDEVKAGVFCQAAGTYAGDPAVRAALQKALDSLQSDGEYRRLASALAKGGAPAR